MKMKSFSNICFFSNIFLGIATKNYGYSDEAFIPLKTQSVIMYKITSQIKVFDTPIKITLDAFTCVNLACTILTVHFHFA